MANTPQLSRQAARIVMAVGCLEACIMPWVMLGIFTLVGFCSISLSPVSAACSNEMSYIVPITMVMFWWSGFAVFLFGQRLLPQGASTQVAGTGPVTRL